MTEDRLDRLERKVDAIGNDVLDIKIAFAEFRGARKVVYAIASVLGAIAGVVAVIFTRRSS